MPKLCSPQKAFEALENGEAIPVKLVQITNQALLTEIENTRQCPGSMTVMVMGGVMHSNQHPTRISVETEGTLTILKKLA